MCKLTCTEVFFQPPQVFIVNQIKVLVFLSNVQVWKESKPAGSKATYVWNKTQFDAVDASQTDFLLGKLQGHRVHKCIHQTALGSSVSQ